MPATSAFPGPVSRLPARRPPSRRNPPSRARSRCRSPPGAADRAPRPPRRASAPPTSAASDLRARRRPRTVGWAACARHAKAVAAVREGDTRASEETRGDAGRRVQQSRSGAPGARSRDAPPRSRSIRAADGSSEAVPGSPSMWKDRMVAAAEPVELPAPRRPPRPPIRRALPLNGRCPRSRRTRSTTWTLRRPPPQRQPIHSGCATAPALAACLRSARRCDSCCRRGHRRACAGIARVRREPRFVILPIAFGGDLSGHCDQPSLSSIPGCLRTGTINQIEGGDLMSYCTSRTLLLAGTLAGVLWPAAAQQPPAARLHRPPRPASAQSTNRTRGRASRTPA